MLPSYLSDLLCQNWAYSQFWNIKKQWLYVFSVLELANGWSNMYQIFTCLALVSYVLEHQLTVQESSSQVAYHFRGVDCIRRVPIGVGGWARRWARWWFWIWCIRPSYGPFMALNWLKWREMHSRHLYSPPQSCVATHSHPRLAKLPFGFQATRTDLHCATEKHPAKANHSSVACFECEIWIIHVPQYS